VATYIIYIVIGVFKTSCNSPLAFVNISTLIAARRLYIVEIQFKKRRAERQRMPAPRVENTPSIAVQLKGVADKP